MAAKRGCLRLKEAFSGLACGLLSGAADNPADNCQDIDPVGHFLQVFHRVGQHSGISSPKVVFAPWRICHSESVGNPSAKRNGSRILYSRTVALAAVSGVEY